MKPILKELMEAEMLEESQEPIKHNGVTMLKYDNEKQCRKVVFYLNSHYGQIADLAYIPASNPYLKDDAVTHGHVATVRQANGHQPNDTYSAYEKKALDKSGFPIYENIDIEARVKHRRPGIQKKSQKSRLKSLRKKHASGTQSRNKKNAFGVTEVSWHKKNASKDEDQTETNRAVMENTFNGAPSSLKGTRVDSRKAVELEYTKQARKLRSTASRTGTEMLRGQFSRDFGRNLIACKKRTWQYNRTNKIYALQGNTMLEKSCLKQKYDPNCQTKTAAASKSVWGKR